MIGGVLRARAVVASGRYEVGQESKVLEALVETVNRRDLPFDWFDAAVLSLVLCSVHSIEAGAAFTRGGATRLLGSSSMPRWAGSLCPGAKRAAVLGKISYA